LVPIGMEVEAALTRQRLEDAVTPVENAARYMYYSAASPPHQQEPISLFPRVSEVFPAPNAWIPGGYRPFHTKLSKLVNEATK